jgi:hypothetical protein
MAFYEHDKRLADAREHLKKLREDHEAAKQKFIDESRGKPMMDLLECNLAVRYETFESPLTESEKLLLYYIREQEEWHNDTKAELQKHRDVINMLRDLLRL